ncbi:TPA: hypothetical protein ACXDAB_003429 [Clostridium botulinum]|uniref:hypothetical protein n=1 Tax=Clostridium botulinum TaxID=1491 RepID=UPI002147E290|nr:hypothetical protein [Clostridium botulinum]MCR1167330.1 hypothetical protein [Clostridium botulinum]
MTDQELIKANEIKEEIETLEAEVFELAGRIQTTLRRFLKLPPKKTYKHLYCIDYVDLIDSRVVLREDEIIMLTQYKVEKIKKLKEELENL